MRRYAMTRVRAGDYLIPADDAQSLWRVTSYEEDGSAEGVTGTFWAAYKFRGSMEQAERLLHRDPEEFLAWSEWDSWAHMLATRREALDCVR